MPAKERKPLQPPKGINRILLRLPITLYRIGLGWLLGDRFLMLEHTGRKSGLLRRVVVEVMRHDRSSDIFIVAVGFGTESDWYLNLMAHPEATIQVGNRRIAVRAERLPPEGAYREIADYGRRHPATLRALLRFMRMPFEENEEGYRRVSQMMPIIQFEPNKPEREDV